MFEVHVFAATAKASEKNPGGYRPGDRHAMLIFRRQLAKTDHDWAEAEKQASEPGWFDFEFERAGTLSPENLNGKSAEFRDAFERAMLGGCGVIVYREMIPVDDGN